MLLLLYSLRSYVSTYKVSLVKTLKKEKEES
jgi:hypothetical protein